MSENTSTETGCRAAGAMGQDPIPTPIVVAVSAADVQATFCATLVDEWVARGVGHAVVAPGSRSTPIALALAGRPELRVHVVHDERAAGFVALGLGVDAPAPPLLLCTSGTAAANFLPAVVEAGLSGVGLIVLTADRPPELRGVGAPQTIDQLGLYGSAVRWFHDAPVPGEIGGAGRPAWRELAAAAFAASRAGPAHLNLPFREPLLGTAGELPPPRDRSLATPPARPAPPAGAVPALAGRGVILAGGRSGVAPARVAELAARTGWPVLADPLSGCRSLDAAVTAFDALLRHAPFADAHRPDLVVRVGRPAASRVLAEWVVAAGAPVVQVGGPGVIDPDHNVVARVEDPADLPVTPDRRDTDARGRDWLEGWVRASRAAEAAVGAALGPAGPYALSEPAVARLVAENRPPGSPVVVASSMPVRDYEWYGGPRAEGHANRGANGIDGVVSTALGLALRGRPVVALVGDVAFVHDSGALTALRRRDVDLRVVVVDNDGGGIFSFLPQARALAADCFEELFGTPHGTDVVALARAHGLDAVTVATPAALIARLGAPGPHVTRVASDRPANVAVHAAVHAAVAAAAG